MRKLSKTNQRRNYRLNKSNSKPSNRNNKKNDRNYSKILEIFVKNNLHGCNFFRKRIIRHLHHKSGNYGGNHDTCTITRRKRSNTTLIQVEMCSKVRSICKQNHNTTDSRYGHLGTVKMFGPLYFRFSAVSICVRRSIDAFANTNFTVFNLSSTSLYFSSTSLYLIFY